MLPIYQSGDAKKPAQPDPIEIDQIPNGSIFVPEFIYNLPWFISNPPFTREASYHCFLARPSKDPIALARYQEVEPIWDEEKQREPKYRQPQSVRERLPKIILFDRNRDRRAQEYLFIPQYCVVDYSEAGTPFLLHLAMAPLIMQISHMIPQERRVGVHVGTKYFMEVSF